MVPYSSKVNGLKALAGAAQAGLRPRRGRAAGHGSELLYVCSPNNPTGTSVSRAALERLVDNAPGIVLVDEAYAEFTSESFLDLARTRPNVLVTRTLSKAFGLAGMRVGYAVGSEALVGEVEKARGPYSVNGLGERMAIAALTEDVAWMKAHAAEAVAIRARLSGRAGEAALRRCPSEANFVLVPLAGGTRGGGAHARAGCERACVPGIDGHWRCAPGGVRADGP
jgi:histidinol-phosphate aminotransferase